MRNDTPNAACDKGHIPQNTTEFYIRTLSNRRSLNEHNTAGKVRDALHRNANQAKQNARFALMPVTCRLPKGCHKEPMFVEFGKPQSDFAELLQMLGVDKDASSELLRERKMSMKTTCFLRCATTTRAFKSWHGRF